MSRNIWKKFSGTKSNINQSFCSKSDEIDLEKIVNQLQQVEESSKKIMKHAKKYNESLLYLSKSEVKLINNFSTSELCHQDEELRDLIESWLTVASKLDKITPNLENLCQKAVVDPMKKYQSFFTGVYTTLKKRQALLQDCHKYQEKVEKLNEKEKIAQNIVKIAQAKKSLEAAKQEFQEQNQILLKELPIMLETRIEYFQPCLEALIRAQVSFYGEEAQIVRDVPVRKDIGNMSSPTVSIIEKKLQEIKSLSIVDED